MGARVLLIEDDVDYQRAVAEQLRSEGFVVTELGSDLQHIDVAQFDAALVDLRLGHGASGHAVISSLRAASSSLCIAALTSHSADEDIFAALAAGADGYLSKSESIDKLSSHIQSLLNGGAPLTASIAKRLMNHFKQTAGASEASDLSPRELAILQHLGAGLTFTEAAHELSITLETVKTMVKRIRTKLHANSVAQAISIGFRMGFLR
jgi:two-component system, NarL family, response regulator LiaR